MDFTSFKKSPVWLGLRGRLHSHLIGLLTHHLAGCKTVLDLGCGGEPYVGQCSEVERVIGVDACYEACLSAQKANKYVRVVQSVLPQLPFRARSVDGVTMLQVVEHLPKETASRLIEEVEEVARQKVIITTPNGFVEQDGDGRNPFQRHLSGWTVEDFEQRGYKVWGMEGPKIARRSCSAEMLPPQQMMSVLNSFGILEGYLRTRPRRAFQLMAVKIMSRV